MLEFATKWSYFLIAWAILSIAMGVISYNLLQKDGEIDKPLKGDKISIHGLLIANAVWTVIFGFIFILVLNNIALDDIKLFLEKPDLIVLIDKKQMEKESAEKIIDDFKKIKIVQAHHSHSTRRFQLTLISKADTMLFDIAQDSDIHEEFWVFWPKNNRAIHGEAGRFNSEFLIDILSSKNKISIYK